MFEQEIHPSGWFTSLLVKSEK